MSDLFGGGDSNGSLPRNALDTRDEYVNRQIRSWSLMGRFFAILIPWVWLYCSFAYNMGEVIAVTAAIIMHAGLVLAWAGRRRSDGRLKWAGVACYPAAIAISLLLNEIL